MRRRALIVVVVATMALAVGQAAFAAAASEISIRYNTTTEKFHGKVTSGNAECQAGRTVKVFKKTASGPALQGKTTSKADGSWKVDVMHPSGHYFAKTPTQEVMHSTCEGARSRTIDVM